MEVLENWKILVLLSKKSTFKVRIIEAWALMGEFSSGGFGKIGKYYGALTLVYKSIIVIDLGNNFKSRLTTYVYITIMSFINRYF